MERIRSWLSALCESVIKQMKTYKMKSDKKRYKGKNPARFAVAQLDKRARNEKIF